MKVRIYSSPVVGWAGIFANHGWIAISSPKEFLWDEDDNAAPLWKVFEIIDIKVPDHLQVYHTRTPESPGPGRSFALNTVLRGEVELHDDYYDNLSAHILTYPNRCRYVRYPGPNSNSFIQWILNEYPEIDIKLPWNMIGKDFKDA